MSSLLQQLIKKSAASDWLSAGAGTIWEINPFRRDLKGPALQGLKETIANRLDKSGNYSLLELSLENLWFSQFLVEEITAAIMGSQTGPHRSLEFHLVHVVAELESSLSLVLEVLPSVRSRQPKIDSSAITDSSVDHLYISSFDLLSESQRLLSAAANTGAMQGELDLFYSALGVINELNRDQLGSCGGVIAVSQGIAKGLGLELEKPLK